MAAAVSVLLVRTKLSLYILILGAGAYKAFYTLILGAGAYEALTIYPDLGADHRALTIYPDPWSRSEIRLRDCVSELYLKAPGWEGVRPAV